MLIPLKKAAEISGLTITQIRYKIEKGELEAHDQARDRGRALKMVDEDELRLIVGTQDAASTAAAKGKAALQHRKLVAQIEKLEQDVQLNRQKIIDEFRDQIFQEMRALWQPLKNAMDAAKLTRPQKIKINKAMNQVYKSLNG